MVIIPIIVTLMRRAEGGGFGCVGSNAFNYMKCGVTGLAVELSVQGKVIITLNSY